MTKKFYGRSVVEMMGEEISRVLSACACHRRCDFDSKCKKDHHLMCIATMRVESMAEKLARALGVESPDKSAEAIDR